MIYLGADPGKSGGIAFIKRDKISAFKMPETPRDLLDLFSEHCAGEECYAVTENVHSSPQMGVVSAFSFGFGYGILRTALIAQGIPHDVVGPKKWMAFLGCSTKGVIGQTKAKKEITKRKAQELFPGVKIFNYNAEALLIAEYARRTHVR